MTERSSPQRRSSQVDLPRLREGGLDAAIYGIVTAGLPLIGGFRPFTLWRRWPASARRTRWQATLFELERLSQLERDSLGGLRRVWDLPGLLAARQAGQHAAFAGVEGAQALDGDARRVRVLHARGVLSMGLVHLTGNALGGSSFPLGNTGRLTPFGWQVVREMEAVGMWIDVAHLSDAAFWEVLQGTRGPIFCSHTGLRATRASWRNLSDEQLRAIAARGGVIGIMLAPQFLSGDSLQDWVRAVKHASAIVGPEHVALGSDMDGFVTMVREVPDVSALPQVTRALLAAGIDREEVRLILGGSFLRMLERFRGTALGSSEANAVGPD